IVVFDVRVDHDEFVFLVLIVAAIGLFISIVTVEEYLTFFQSHTRRLYDAFHSFITQLDSIFHQEIAIRKVMTLVLL
ncbi:transcriptional regulator, partial [Bacillus sp. PsM16]|nr:transcriptional regulator [Bacillus sp. PsM16]